MKLDRRKRYRVTSTHKLDFFHASEGYLKTLTFRLGDNFEQRAGSLRGGYFGGITYASDGNRYYFFGVKVKPVKPKR